MMLQKKEDKHFQVVIFIIGLSIKVQKWLALPQSRMSFTMCVSPFSL